jgi:hypothetical protein
MMLQSQQLGNDTATAQWRAVWFKLAKMPQLLNDEQHNPSRWWCTIQVGDDDATAQWRAAQQKLAMMPQLENKFSNCSEASSTILQKCVGTWNGSWWYELAWAPQLLNDEQHNASWHGSRNCSMMSSTTEVSKKAAAAQWRAVWHKLAWKLQLLNDEQHDASRQWRRDCSTMSSMPWVSNNAATRMEISIPCNSKASSMFS